jgi:hypothetical protein
MLKILLIKLLMCLRKGRNRKVRKLKFSWRKLGV